MNISPRLENYLNYSLVEYEIIHHAPTQTSYDSACAANIALSSVVKAVVLKDRYDGQLVLALVPATNMVNLAWASSTLNRHLELADEAEAASLFPDCELGAIPGICQAYNIALVWEDQLMFNSEFYFESGSHEDLVKIGSEQFLILFDHLPHARISTLRENNPLFRTNTEHQH